jgi:hypothetical protein
MIQRPTFLVIGAAKGGTTSLHFYLRQHPDVYMPPSKEINFYWDGAAAAGRTVPATFEAYRQCFAGATTQRAIGEISPQYLNSPSAARRIRADLPDVRLVVSLRNPADRAYSDYLGRIRIDRERRPFREAVQPGERILEDGFYAPRLRRFLEQFPRTQLHVILHEEYARDTTGTLRSLFAFLGVDPSVHIDTARRYNPAETPVSRRLNRLIWSAIPRVQRLMPLAWRGTGLGERVLRRTYRAAPPFPPEERRRLQEIYRDDVLETGELIGRDLREWIR